MSTQGCEMRSEACDRETTTGKENEDAGSPTTLACETSSPRSRKEIPIGLDTAAARRIEVSVATRSGSPEDEGGSLDEAKIHEDYLCAACRQIFADPTDDYALGSGAHHSTARDLQMAAEAGCFICRFLQQRVRGEFLHRTEWMLGGLGLNDLYLSCSNLSKELSVEKFTVVRRDDSWLLRAGRASTAQRYTGCDESFSLIKEWISTCLRSHAACRQNVMPSWYPTRLLKCSSRRIRLIETAELHCQSPYATMSYCRGQDPFLMLTADNDARFCTGVDLFGFPQLFREASMTCQKIGVSYIWIDCYCIIQSGLGSEQDWQSESANMRKVYTIGGVAQRMSQMVEDEYVAGMFKATLLHDLNGKLQQARASEWRAPTWSWAASDGGVNFPSFILDYKPEAMATIHNVNVQLANPNDPFGALLSASLELTCRLCCAYSSMRAPGSDEFWIEFEVGEEVPERSRWKPDVYSEFDAPPSQLYLVLTELAVFKNGEVSRTDLSALSEEALVCSTNARRSDLHDFHFRYYGLVLQRDEDGWYRRVGILEKHWASARLYKRWRDTQEEVITVI